MWLAGSPLKNFPRLSTHAGVAMYTAGLTMEVQVLSVLYAALIQVKLLLLVPSRDRSRSCMGIPVLNRWYNYYSRIHAHITIDIWGGYKTKPSFMPLNVSFI